MDDRRIQASVRSAETLLEGYLGGLGASTALVKASVRAACGPLQEEVSINLTSCETRLTRVISLICEDAEYHILTAYYRASPGVISFIIGILKFIAKLIGIIETINEFALLITGENLAYWLDKLIPGFQDAWNDIMNKISEFSGMLGWGVDGVLHLMNATHAGADLWGMVTGKEMDTVRVEKYKRTEILMNSYSKALYQWQVNPGEQIAKYAEEASARMYWGGYVKIHEITDKLGAFGDKAEEALTGLGTISSELLGIRNDMPAFIAKNIPQGLWDGIERVDTAINDRILPALRDITDRIDELDAVLDSYQKKAAELAERLAHPGDMLAEIDKLPGYARKEQLTKIDDVTSSLLREQNEAEYAALEGDLREFGIIAEALSHPPAPLEFMELELPGRAPGIVAEPRETWFAGDY